MQGGLVIDFAGEIHRLAPGGTFTIGRQGDLALDDNPYLHRRFIEVHHSGDLWWVHNVGSRLPAHLTAVDGTLRSTLAPGSRQPLVAVLTLLTFTGGMTHYEIELSVEGLQGPAARGFGDTSRGDTTIAPTGFTESQLLAVLALAEPVLKRAGTGAAEVPSAVQAARRLGWTQTRFNRKLDNVCDKLERAGVTGLRGGPGRQASNRRGLLVDYAVSTLLVKPSDLPKLARESAANALLARPKEDLE